MNITLWILQALLAVHTVMGALWKFSNSEQAVPSLKAIPHGAWMLLSVVELACAAGLLVPAVKKSLGNLAPIAALVIAGEMLLYCVVHLVSGDANFSPMLYWLVVAGFCSFVAYGRWKVRPIQ